MVRRGSRFSALACCLAVLVVGVGCGPSPDVDLDLDRVRNAIVEHRFEWARPVVDACVEARPANAEAWRLAADAWLHGRAGSLSRGTDALARSVELAPADTESRRRLVRLLLVSDRLDQAIDTAAGLGDECGDRALRVEVEARRDAEAASRSVETLLVECPESIAVDRLASRNLDDGERALGSARRVVAFDPLDRPSLVRLLEILRDLGRGEETAEVVELFAIAQTVARTNTRRLDPSAEFDLLAPVFDRYLSTSPQLRVRRALLMLGADKAGAAEAGAAAASAPGTTVEQLLALGRAAAAGGRNELAVRCFERLVDLDPGRDEARLALAEARWSLGRRDAVREEVTAIVAERPYLARGHVLQSTILQLDGDQAAAVEELEAAVRLAPWSLPWRRELVDRLLVFGDSARALRVAKGAEEPTDRDALVRRVNSR